MTMDIVYHGAPEELDIMSRRREIEMMLHNHVCEVSFTKIDGSKRVMPCTLLESAMPQQAVNEFHQTRPFKPETLSVFCTDKGEWRAFRVANVTQVKVLDAH